MATSKKEKATSRVRLFPSTNARIALRGAKAKPRKTAAEVIDELERNDSKKKK